MIGAREKLNLAMLILLAFASISSAQRSQTDIYFAKEIWTAAGAPILDGAMAVVDGQIVAVGPRSEITVPPEATTHELGSQVIIPGLIGVQTNLSGTQTEERTLTPAIRAIDGFDFFADRDQLLESGVTTVQLSPGSARLMPGTSGVVQLAGKGIGNRILSETESLRIVLSASSRNPPRIYEPPVGPVSEDRPLMATRPQLSTLPASLAGLRQILKQATAKEKFVSENEYDAVVETVAELLQNEVPLRVTAQTAPEIRGAIELAKEFDLKIVLDDCRGLEPFRDHFANWKKYVNAVILSGETPGRIANLSASQMESQSNRWEYARELVDAGIPIAIRTEADGDLSQLFYVAGQFLQDGLTQAELLDAVTRSPAKLMNVADQVGTLEKGKRADFVVLNGQPFRLHSRVQSTFVSGVSQFHRKLNVSTTVVQADRVYVGDGKFLEDASVVVKGSTVRGIGESVSAPAGADVKTFDGGVIVPGFIDMGTGLGLGGPLRGNINLQTKLGEQLYADDPAIEYARQHGITTALLSAASSSQATPVVAFKLGSDARVISDPIAVRFRLTGDTATGIAANERLLKAGKAYADSWTKYEKDFAEYETKRKAWESKQKSEAKKATAKPTKKAGSNESKKEEDKKDKATEVKKPDAKTTEKKEKVDEKKEPKKKPLSDPITGTWEGELESERLPERFRKLQFELVLDGDSITGSVTMMGRGMDIGSGSFDRKAGKVKFTVTNPRGEMELECDLDADGNLSGSFSLGRMGTVEFSATRTVDKSKKPEPDSDAPEKKGKPTDGKKEKPAGDTDKPDEKKESSEEKEKTAEPKKDDAEKKADDKSATDKASEKKDDQAPKEPKKPKANPALEPYRTLFAGEIPALVEARDLNSIKAAAELFSVKYKIRTILVGADDLARQPDLLDGYSVSVCTGPQFSVNPDNKTPTNLPQLLSNERLPFGFQSLGTSGAGMLPKAVQFSVSQGLSATDALDGLTSNPAKMLSDELNFGHLATGKDADLVVLSGSPFEFSTKVLAVMIDGVWVYEREEQK